MNKPSALRANRAVRIYRQRRARFLADMTRFAVPELPLHPDPETAKNIALALGANQAIVQAAGIQWAAAPVIRSRR